MGTTEESIVYQLLSSIRASELNNDEVVTERRVRSFLRTHRASLMNQATLEGRLVDDDFFQTVELQLKKINAIEYVSPLPSLIALTDNFGIKLLTPGFENIPVESEERYHLGKKSPINKFNPSAMVFNGELTIRIPTPSPYAMNGGQGNKVILNCLESNKDKVKMMAVLDNPDDGFQYDWTVDAYPVPPELIQPIKDNVLKKEFNIILATKSDQVPNAKNDTLRYHDQGTVQQ